MRYPPQLLDEIRTRLNVSDVVGRSVALKKKGREFAGLSPFKSEKTASFFVNDQKAFYHCFASGEHGDIFSFLMKVEGLSFPEAVERLADEAGVELPKQAPVNPERENERTRLLDLLERTTLFFAAQLKTSQAREARAYLDRRGLTPETIADFRIGYAPNDRNALTQHLKQAGFTDHEIVLAGMRISGEDISTPYDRFRDRIIFPIADTRGKIVAFGGRALDANQKAKYLNSPETPVFHKGHLLYNAHQARTPAHDAGHLIVAEGYMDVIALAQAGFGHAVAPLGTALTADQIQLLWRMCPEPTLCFDGDSAGKRAAHRAIDTVLPLIKPGFSLQFAFLPSGIDPDDLIREQGAPAFEQIMSRSHSLSETLWEREWQAGQWDTPERRAQLESSLRKLVQSVQDQAVRAHYGQIIAEKLRNAWRSPDQNHYDNSAKKRFSPPGKQRRGNGKTFNKGSFAFQDTQHSPSLKSSTIVSHVGTNQYREALLLRTFINHPWLIEEVAEELAELSFHSANLASLQDALLSASADEKNLDTSVLCTHLKASGFAPTLEFLERTATNKCHAFAEPDAERVDVENGWRHTLSLHQQQSLRDQLMEAEREYRVNLDEDALARILELQRLIATIMPSEAVFD